MKIIETKYRGYHFRSRLEARWAVFFDEIGLPFKYEEEGYDLNNTWYLPDFWIPAWEAFVEIKGKTPTREEILKARLLCNTSNKIVLIITGSPWPDDYTIFPFFPFKIHHDLFDTGAEFLQCRRCECIAISKVESGGEVMASYRLGHPNAMEDCKGCSDRDPVLSGELEKAFKAAREARFENS